MSESYILRSEIYLFPALSDSVSAVLGARQRKRGIFFKPGGKRMKPGSHTHTHITVLTVTEDIIDWENHGVISTDSP